MILEGNFEFLGAEIKKGKNSDYVLVALLQGTDSVNVITRDIDKYKDVAKLTKFQEVKCKLDVIMGKYPRIEFISLK